MATDRTLADIRARLQHFIAARQKAYDQIIRSGHQVPGYSEKVAAILMLRVQLQASELWDIQANLRWIHALQNHIRVLLPSEFHEDLRQRKYRQRMLDMLAYCELLLDSKPFFHRNPKAA